MPELRRFQFFDPSFQADPFRTYAEMRREAPVAAFDPIGFVTVARHADVVAVLRLPQQFSSEGFRPAFEPPWVGVNPGARGMLVMDPPNHTKLRNLVSRAFGASFQERAEPFIRARAERAADAIAARGRVEVVDEVSVPMTAGVLGDVLTLDPAVHAELKRWSDDMASVTPVPESPEHEARVKRSIAEMTGYLTALIDERRRAPGDDLVSTLVAAEVDGQQLTDDELVAFLFLLIVAGLETTANLIAKSLIVIADRPALAARLHADPALVPAFIEEMLRFDPPTHGLFRVTTSDVEIAGTPVAAHTPLMVLLASANRDERVHPNGDAFDLDRVQEQSVAFGHGPHFCIGAGLARLETKLTLEALVRRFSRFDHAGGPIAWRHTLTVRAPAAVPLAVS
jgi:cytochrome P450